MLTAPLSAWSAPAAAGSASGRIQEESLSLFVGQSLTVSPPWAAKRVSVSDPKIADVQVLTPNQLLVQGKASGTTDVMAWNDEEQLWRARLDVTMDLKRLSEDVQRLFPESNLSISESNGLLVLRGEMNRAERADDLYQYLDALGMKYVDMTSLAGPQQVQLKVRVAEVSRVALRAMGFNFLQANEDFFGGSVIGSSSGPLNPISIGAAKDTVVGASSQFQFTSDLTISPAVTLFAGLPNADLMFFLQALTENQYLRVLAEPNLITLSGEEASFLAGGEFPIPVVQGTSGGGTAITIEYREFGVRLYFRPVVLGDGTIRLNVRPEVSELTDVGAVEIEGFRVPALNSRRSEATLQLKSGEMFAMAGLLNNTVSARTSRVPVLGDVPVLGALFRSVRYQNSETELVVLVTATLVSPLAWSPDTPVPGVLHADPNDWELFMEGRLEGAEPAKVSPAEAAWLKEMGMDRLVGPGAWETYGDPAAQSQTTLRPMPQSVEQGS